MLYVTMTTPGSITGIAYWFEFTLANNLSISTGPSAYEGVSVQLRVCITIYVFVMYRYAHVVLCMCIA